MRPFCALLLAAALAALLLLPATGRAGAQVEEMLSASVQSSLHRAVSDFPAPHLMFATEGEGRAWLADMSSRLATKMPDWPTRRDFLVTVQYEASRAGLDPQLVLGLIEHESNFRKFAVSSAGARGYMQVMPFWLTSIGSADQDLFHLRTNLRYGCTILR
ncbi:MAG: transglycosylase SLT domain-containing protein, partial [Casimicrobiaceae bacterium]